MTQSKTAILRQLREANFAEQQQGKGKAGKKEKGRKSAHKKVKRKK